MDKPKTAPTLEDVAAQAGVSTATVSRCLNTPELVVETTRVKVMQAVKALGYTPNFAARVMAAKRTFTIGAIIPTMDNAVFAWGLQSFQEALHAQGYTLLVASSAYQPEIEEEQIRALAARGADGLLLIGHDRSAEIYDYIARRDIPALVAWTYQDDSKMPCVGFDNCHAMKMLTDKVIGLGHTRIAVISGVQDGNDRARHRLQGIRQAARAQGITLPDNQIIETPYDIEHGAEAFARLMTQDPKPSVVMCGNDVLATGALRMAHHLGLDVPGEISVTGFDDIELARIVTPGLTTVHVPHREMGRIAAEDLIEMVEGRGHGQSTRLQTEIIWRQSLAQWSG